MSQDCIYCNNENTTTHLLRIDQDEVLIVECLDNECADYFVHPEDKRDEVHTPSKPMCVSTLEPALATESGDEFQVYCCPACGFYTSER